MHGVRPSGWDCSIDPHLRMGVGDFDTKAAIIVRDDLAQWRRADSETLRSKTPCQAGCRSWLSPATCLGQRVFLRSMHYLERDVVTGQPNGAARVTGHVPRSMIRSSPREDLRRLLDSCGRPLAPEEVARLLGVSERFVAYMLMEAMRSGRVGRSADGRYETAMGRGGAALTELLQFVVECERSWRGSGG